MDCHWSHSIFKKSDVLFYSIFDHLSLIWGFFKGIYVILDIEYTLISSAFVRRIAWFALLILICTTKIVFVHSHLNLPPTHLLG